MNFIRLQMACQRLEWAHAGTTATAQSPPGCPYLPRRRLADHPGRRYADAGHLAEQRILRDRYCSRHWTHPVAGPRLDIRVDARGPATRACHAHRRLP